jgi:hypothetical protein
MSMPDQPHAGPSGAADERTPDDVDAEDVTLDDLEADDPRHVIDDEAADRRYELERAPAQTHAHDADRLAGPLGQPEHPDALVGDEGGTGHYGRQRDHRDDPSKD